MPKRGYRKARKKRPNQRVDGYDSDFEMRLHKGILSKWENHSQVVEYDIPKKYHPDFVRKFGGKTILIEAKGRFWDSAEYSKYIHVARCLPDNYELVFLFYNPDLPMPRAKVRQDGTKRSHREWAEANGFRWFDEKNFLKEWK